MGKEEGLNGLLHLLIHFLDSFFISFLIFGLMRNEGSDRLSGIPFFYSK